DLERGTDAFEALDADPAAVRLHDALGDSEPEARARDLTGRLILDPVELVEDMWQVAGGDAHARVGHTNPHRLGSIASGPQRRRNAHTAPRGRVFDAVVDEVDQDLAHAARNRRDAHLISAAKPALTVMGHLMSWETVLTKSLFICSRFLSSVMSRMTAARPTGSPNGVVTCTRLA